ncbi:MAG: glycosyltransferase family 2 protein [Candidatus Omnitrophota bacterium]|jgi:glycosyltransferase involved in cell wall biosynthesis
MTASKNPKLSIVTPVLNGIRYIEFCIQNVIDQKCPEAEHIIIDGGSTDGTLDIIKRYVRAYSHIRWVSERDRGQSDAMNKGIQMARGAIISFLNVDDFYEPNLFTRVLKLFEALPSPSFVTGNCRVWDNEGKIAYVSCPSKLRLFHLMMGSEIHPFPLNPSSYFYHKVLHDFVGKYNVNSHYNLDQEFIFKVARKIKMIYINEVWGNFRLIEGTKTYKDLHGGTLFERQKFFLSTFWKQLPLQDKMQFYFYKLYRSLFFRFRRILSYYIPLLCKISKTKTKNRLGN